jgi:hypothetical protein
MYLSCTTKWCPMLVSRAVVCNCISSLYTAGSSSQELLIIARCARGRLEVATGRGMTAIWMWRRLLHRAPWSRAASPDLSHSKSHAPTISLCSSPFGCAVSWWRLLLITVSVSQYRQCRSDTPSRRPPKTVASVSLRTSCGMNLQIRQADRAVPHRYHMSNNR